ncbi:3-phenylpropionate/trans-cinnamate dioxygenase ferredoxin reductase subunit [Klenkia soli]|uniref:3-phenylpropionate/trans-cinnamate dioxygenase ferredoxin reductase subunit n=1 Tax=Klenkia soli TaxID=1052260 RepID=A0A1H0FWT8_9ACTN|nr:FAD-dependent oxidoreductase [Klenkia soli]SDN99083.1 3-phenylpropionate/trans-cinnamate dioxygenase ferredoxin reductase subunit [Klenkia soli]
MSGLLVVGSSQAGVSLATSLRALGHEGPITLLGDERHRPYQRPALSKEWLQGTVTSESLLFRSDSYWPEHGIDLVKGERVIRVDKADDGSGVAHSMSGAQFAFDRLALAVGARPRRLVMEGTDLPGVLYLRNADDALELKARLPDVRDVVVIGGGFIGIEAAASLTTLGRSVTLVEAAPRLVARAVGEQTSAHLLEHHRSTGIEVLLGTSVRRITARSDHVGGVELADGRVLPADLVLVGVGVVPNTGLAESIGLNCADGVLVDETAVASDGHTMAIGDCANQPNPMPGAPPGDRVRFESVNNAIEQAKVAAYAITGRREEYAGIPWFWSNQGAVKLQIAGLSTGHDRTLVRRDAGKGKQSVLYYRGERLLAADCINSPLDFLAVKAALSKGLAIPFVAAADPAVQLKAVTQPAPVPVGTAR